MDILRIATAGSVDVGKSTLIGRLLYETKSVTKDKLEAIELSSRNKGLDFTDFSLLTDGLIAERAQNITIDVAHIYFATANRKYIIADSPGHFEFIRNMITGASNVQAFIVLIDATIGITEQTKRHLFIASLLNMQTVFVCINKMDAVNFDEKVFTDLEQQATSLTTAIAFNGELVFIPIVAKGGDNITLTSKNTNWYKGRTLLDYMEAIPVHKKDIALPLRMQIQNVIKHPTGNKVYYTGKVCSGTITKGQSITLLPYRTKVAIASIFHSGKEVDRAIPGESVTIAFNKQVDAVRGDMIIGDEHMAGPQCDIFATVCWLNDQPMLLEEKYILQHGVHRVEAVMSAVYTKFNFELMEEKAHHAGLQLNEIGRTSIKTNKTIFADTFKRDPANGTFILIHPITNNTVAVGFIEQIL